MVHALLFPGQGSQTVGMGKELYASSIDAKRILDEACDVLGYDIKSLMFDGPQEVLTDTKYAQPAIYTTSAMYLAKLKSEGIEYDFVAGHSLGEYNALLAAGVYEFAAGLRLVEKRGNVMGQANGKGTMAAVMGLSEDELQEYVKSYVPDVVIANLNSKTQLVISGVESMIDEIGESLGNIDGLKFRKLSVSAAFHSPQMEEAAVVMEEVIGQVSFHEPVCYVLPNVTGTATKDASEIKRCLIAQITGQVRWYDTIMALKDSGVDLFYEVGYGDVLKKLNKTILFRPKCIGVNV